MRCEFKLQVREQVSKKVKIGMSARLLLMLLMVGVGLLGGATAGSLDLASALFAEGQWASTGLESRRVLATDPPQAEADQARLLSASSALRLPGEARKTSLQTLEALWKSERCDLNLRCRSAYELALAREMQNERLAVEALVFAYSRAEEVELFWQAGCALYFRLQANGAWRKEFSSLWQTLQTSSRSWPSDLVQEHRERIAAQRSSWTRLPARWLVSFYSAQIAPAIGSRCELQPSCSAYLLEACQKHGLLGYTLMADRFIREPSVYDAKQKPVVLQNGRIKYADPLSDHDFWMKDKQ